MKPSPDSPRVNVRHGLFIRVAKEHQIRFHAVGKSINYRTTDADTDMAAHREFYTHAYTTILFSSLALESVIYDFGARHLGDSFTKEHLDKLDVISKWIIIPRLVVGKELPKDGELYSMLKATIGARNDLAHSKTQPFPTDKDGKLDIDLWFTQIQQHETRLTKIVDGAMNAVLKLCRWLADVSGDTSVILYVSNE